MNSILTCKSIEKDKNENKSTEAVRIKSVKPKFI